MSLLFYLAIVLFVIVCVVLCAVVLVQESKGSGLGASFGGDVSESMFGTATAEVLQRFTGWMVAVFLISCVVLSLWTEALSRIQVSGPPLSIEEAPE